MSVGLLFRTPLVRVFTFGLVPLFAVILADNLAFALALLALLLIRVTGFATFAASLVGVADVLLAIILRLSLH